MPNSNSAVVRPLTTRRRGLCNSSPVMNSGFWAPAAPAPCHPQQRQPGQLGSAARSAIESLEDRQLMSVVYVSASSGNNGNSGRNSGDAVKTIARAKSMMRSGDQMLLKSGDSWGEAIGQWDLSNTTIGAYGSGAKPRINTSSDGIWLNQRGQSNITLRGISLNGTNRTNKVGLCVVGSVSNIRIENSEIKGFRMNVNLIGSRGSIRNFTISNSNISNSNGNGMSSGIFADGVNGITIENSTFDRNGGTSGSMYNHGAYLTGQTSNVTVRNSTFSNSSSYGLQARSGGTITGNKFINNSVGLSVGIVNGAGQHTSGGVNINVSNNSFSGRGARRNRGLGIDVGNVRSGTIANNRFSGGTGVYYHNAIALNRGTGGGSQVGVQNLKITGNDATGWGGKLYKAGNAGVRNLMVSGNRAL